MGGDNLFQKESVKADYNCNYNNVFEFMSTKANNKDPSTNNINGK